MLCLVKFKFANNHHVLVCCSMAR